MEYRPLGTTGLRVSALALGTVGLGIDYGIRVPGQFGRPLEADAVRQLRQAAEAGINLFDTAPAYGQSEWLLGRALQPFPHCHVATKVPIPLGPAGEPLRGKPLQEAVRRSLETSLRALRRDVLDIVQIHNATVEVIRQGEMAEALLEARQGGKVRHLGVSVYTEAEALAAMESRCFEVIQVAYNVLDQRMAVRTFPAAQHAGVGVIVRSALLKGALTAKAQWLPPELAGLREAATQAKDVLAGDWDALPAAALRFCLSAPQAPTVLIGANNSEELIQALAAAAAGRLPPEVLARTPMLALTEERWLNPSHWQVP